MIKRLSIFKTEDKESVVIMMDREFVILPVSYFDFLIRDIMPQIVIDNVLSPEKLLLIYKKGANALIYDRFAFGSQISTWTSPGSLLFSNKPFGFIGLIFKDVVSNRLNRLD